MTGGGTGFDPHPATSRATTAAPATARSSFLMRIRRITRGRGGIEMITLCSRFAVTGDGSGAPRSTVSMESDIPMGR
jgi:hypothetical protein